MSDDIKQEQSQQEEQQPVYYQDDDGMWVIRAKLPPEEGSLVVKTLETVTTEQFYRIFYLALQGS